MLAEIWLFLTAACQYAIMTCNVLIMFHMSVSQGFTELIPIDLIKIFDENELEVTTSHIPITVSAVVMETESSISKTFIELYKKKSAKKACILLNELTLLTRAQNSAFLFRLLFYKPIIVANNNKLIRADCAE